MNPYKKDLARSGLSVRDARAAGMFFSQDATTISSDFLALPALVIPYFDAGGKPFASRTGDPFFRIRYLFPSSQRQPGLVKKKSQKYSQLPGTGARAYFPRAKGVDWPSVLVDSSVPIVITEGEKKALRACLAGVPTIGLGGVYNFMGDGALLPELAEIVWKGRPVYIAFDSDAERNPHIQAAEGRLAQEIGMRRGAWLALARTPEMADGEKAGIDDHIVAFGEEAWLDVLEKARPMSLMEKAVASLNEHVAYIEKEQLVYDMRSGNMIRKDSFTNGSRYSALKVNGVDARGKSKIFSVAEAWLKHPHARRYSSVIFDPSTQGVVTTSDNGETALNLWTGWGELSPVTDKDVESFLRLNDYMLSNADEAVRDLPLKLMTYKAQNPGEKIPLALWFVGLEGSGKSLWALAMREAFAPYGMTVAPATLASDFNGWKERSLLVVVDEIYPKHLEGATKGIIWNNITEKRQQLNEKHRPVRDIDTRYFMLFTSNKRGVVAFGADDRRNIVVDCPGPHPDGAQFYRSIGAWLQDGGGKKILAWMLQQDLKGWRPPSSAPLTAEKHMARMEAMTPVERLAEEAKTAEEHTVYLWLKESLAWAQTADISGSASDAQRAAEIRAAVPRFQIRPWYTPEEISLMFPALSSALFGATKGAQTPLAGRISRELREAGVPYLRNLDDPRGFRVRGRIHQYLVLFDHEDWGAPLTQAQFDSAMKKFPSFQQYAAMRRKNG